MEASCLLQSFEHCFLAARALRSLPWQVGGEGLVRGALWALTPTLPAMGWSCFLQAPPHFRPVSGAMRRLLPTSHAASC